MSKCYITNGVTQDGFGSRLQRAVNVMAFTLHLRDTLGIDVEYIHTPLSYEGFGIDFSMGEVQRWGVYHPYNLEPRDLYLARTKIWDKAIGYKGVTVLDINLSSLKVKNGIQSLFSDIANKQYDGCLYIITHLNIEFDFSRLNINIHDKYRNEILNRMGLEYPEIPESLVAVHIRRQDAINERYIPDGYYLSILHWLRAYGDMYETIIFTQREGFNADLYKQWDVIYDDQEEDYTTFAKLIRADVLICGHSSFSYLAGLLNPNTVVYHNRGHVKMSRWITKQKFINNLKNGKVLLQQLAIG